MSDSVGKITLDLEIASDIGKQVSAISNLMGKNLKDTLNNSFKASFASVNKNAKESLSSVNNTMKNMLSNIKDSASKTLSSAFATMKKIKLPTPKFPEVNIAKPKLVNTSKTISTRGPPTFNKEMLKAQIEGVERTLDNANAKIEQQQSKLAGLREEYNNTFNQARKNKLEEQILKTEGAINKLITTSDKLGFKLADLDAEFKMLGASPKMASAQTNSLSDKTKAFSTNAGKAGNSTKGFSNALKQLGFGAKTTGNNFRGAYGGASMFFSSLFKWGLVFPLIIRGIGAMSKSLFDSLMTNQQFANSLHQIQTNLMVAFTPIFYAVLPAINALMSALATITTYIAMFTSMLFGKTYQASYQATQGLIDAKTAMGAYGESAKKAGKDVKGSLAGFDEINVLTKNKHGANSGGGAKSKVPKLVSPPINTAPTSAAGKAVEKIINGLKAVMATLFNPLKSAWQKDGASVMSAFHKAIDGTKNTLKHLYSVLQTPPVQLFIENIARIGLALVKLALSIYNNFILPLINWFLDKIPGLANGFNPLLEKIIEFINYLSGDGFFWVKGFLGLFLGFKTTMFIVQLALATAGIVKNTIATIANTAAKLADKAETVGIIALYAGQFVKSIISGTAALIKQAAQFVINKGLKVADTIAQIAMTAATVAWNVVCGIATIATTALGVAFAFLTSPIGLVVLAIAAVIAIGVLLYKNWDFVKAKAIEIWGGIKTIFQNFNTWLGSIFSTDWSKSFGFLGEILNAYLANVRNIFSGIKQIFSGIIDFVAGVFTGDWSRAWRGVVEIFKGIVSVLGGIFKTPLNAVIGLINGAIGSINGIKVPKIDLPFGLGTVGGWNIGIPKIPYLAKGGIVDSPTLAMVGEAGKEAVMPLENNTGWITNLAGQIASMLNISNNNSSSNSKDDKQLVINLLASNSTIARIVIESLNEYAKQNGEIPIMI